MKNEIKDSEHTIRILSEVIEDVVDKSVSRRIGYTLKLWTYKLHVKFYKFTGKLK